MIEILKNKTGLFIFQLKDKEGEIILTSNGYTQKTNCMKGIRSLIHNSKNEISFVIKTNEKTREWSLNVKAGNGKITAHGFPMYTENEAKGVMKKVMSIVPSSKIKDLTKPSSLFSKDEIAGNV